MESQSMVMSLLLHESNSCFVDNVSTVHSLSRKHRKSDETKTAYPFIFIWQLCHRRLIFAVRIWRHWKTVFTARSSYASTVLGIVILSFRPSVCPSVCLSVCLSVTCVLCDETKEHTADILMSHERVTTLVFWHQHRLVGNIPFHLKFALSDPFP